MDSISTSKSAMSTALSVTLPAFTYPATSETRYGREVNNDPVALIVLYPVNDPSYFFNQSAEGGDGAVDGGGDTAKVDRD